MSTQPGTAGRLIGRQAELAVIEDRIDSVAAGAGGVLLISGEAGVGKSRLVTELRDRFSAAMPDGVLLAGSCFEGDRALAYAPLLDVLRSYLVSYALDSGGWRLFSSDPAAFVTLLPELQTRLADHPPFDGSAPEQEKHRIFQALLTFIARVAGDEPLIVVFEDLHWSDDASLEFLTHLARLTRTQPVLLVGTFRSEEERPGLRRALVEIDRARLGVELQLARFTVDEVDLLLREIFNQPYSIRPDFLRAIYGLTDGNPFFVEETVRSLIAAGDIYEARGRWTRKDLEQLRIPRSVQDALARHTEYLDDAALQLLENAAVIGQRFDFSLLMHLTDQSEADLLGLLRALIDARLIVEESSDRFRFRHALIRESVYDGLLARERRVRHGQAAAAIEELHTAMPDPWLAELAYHFHAAEHWGKAFEYAEAAAGRAESLFAPAAVIEHVERALEAADQLGREPPARLIRMRGRAHETLGEFTEARHDYEGALEITRAEGDLHAEWETLIDLGRSWEGLDYARAGEWFERALALARRIDDPTALAHNLNRVGSWRLNTERIDGARAAHQEALTIFEEIEHEAGIAATLDYLGMVATIAGDLVEMYTRYERAATMFEQLGDVQRLSSTLATMIEVNGSLALEAIAALNKPTYDETRSWGTRALRLAREAGWRSGEAYALLTLGLVGFVKADYARAFAVVTDAVEVAHEIEHREWLAGGYMALGALYHDVLAGDRALECLEQSVTLAREGGSILFLYLTSGILADVLVEQGMIERAGALLASLPADLPVETVAQRRVWAARARLALAQGEAEAALEILDRLFATGHNINSQGDIPLLAWRRGQALVEVGRTRAAEEVLLAAGAGSIALDQPGKLWRVNLDLAGLYRLLDRDDDAAQSLQDARDTVTKIAERITNEELRRGFLSSASALFDAVDAEPHQPHVAALDQFTPRERDVVLLLARGLSNRQIGDELFIGERTVETHVSNILGKLGFDSRTQVAAWAVEHGLTPVENAST